MQNKVSSKINFSIIDSLRGLASLVVCIAHCRGILWAGGVIYIKLHPFATWGINDWVIMIITSLTKLSGEAVIFFFVLSGFSIAHSLSYQPKPGFFLYKRFVRLYPPYIVGFLFALVVVMVLKTQPGLFFNTQYDSEAFRLFYNSPALFKPENILRTLFYNPPLNTIIRPYWSLVYEIIFYVGAVLFVRKLQWYYVASCIFFITGILASILFPSLQFNSLLYNFAFQYNFYFMIGIFVYHNLDTISSRKWMTGKGWWAICLFLYLLMVGLEGVIEERYNISFLVAALTCILMIVNMLDKKIFIKPLIQIGGFSYTLYVIHFSVVVLIAFCLYSFVHLHPPYIYSFLYWIPAIFVCLGVSYLFYWLIEKKTKQYLNSLRSK
jgi:peptidoglycan/LPS O-acetylase OafA/YrhL